MANEFSVLMSVYKKDNPKEVRQAIESIFTTTITPAEVVLVEDGVLTDELSDLINELSDKYQFIHTIKIPKNGGLANALNTGLKHCNYDFIARMDADDISLPERFEKQLEFLDSHHDVDCVGTWAIEIRSDGNEYYKKKMPITHKECYDFFMQRDCMIHPTVMFRRSYFEKAGMYSTDTYFGEDTMMWAQGFANGCRFANIPEYLFKFRLNDDFFNRRRGWKHAKGILSLRWKVNKMLHYPLKSYLYAIAYAIVKLLPKNVLSILYKTIR